jgi:hypothetical protein
MYIFEIYVKFCIFWYPWSPYCEKKFWTLIAWMAKNVVTNDERWSGHWGKKLFSSVFVTFERYVTNLRGTLVLVPISTHPLVLIVPKPTPWTHRGPDGNAQKICFLISHSLYAYTLGILSQCNFACNGLCLELGVLVCIWNCLVDYSRLKLTLSRLKPTKSWLKVN